MKNKSTRHKEVNTFKFQSFSERISNVDVNIFHKIGHEYEAQIDEDNECYFHQMLEKWNVLNLSEAYDTFKKDLKPYKIITLPQLIHNKNFIVDVLLRHLRYKNVLCLQPLLELTTALCKDLQKEFYQHFPAFFDVCVDLLNTKEPEILEWTFTCLAYLFKFLWRSIVKDIDKVFTKLVSLLSDDVHEYIHNFAAECFAFVARKVRDREKFFDIIVESVKNCEDGAKGCGRLLFETIRSVNGQFHSCAESVLSVSFGSLERRSEHGKIIFEILEELLANVVKNIDPRNCEILWEILLNLSRNVFDSNERNFETLTFILGLIGQLLEYREGRFLRDSGAFTQHFVRFVCDDLSENVLENVAKISVLLLTSKNVKLSQEQASSIVKHVLNLNRRPILLYFVENVCNCSNFDALILPKFLKFCLLNDFQDDCLDVLTKIVTTKSPSFHKNPNFKRYKLDFKDDNKKSFELVLKATNSDEIFTRKYQNFMQCLPHFTYIEIPAINSTIHKNLTHMCELLHQNEPPIDQKGIKNLLCAIFVTLEAQFRLTGDNFPSEELEFLVKVVCSFVSDPTYVCALRVLDLYLTAAKASNGKILCMETLQFLNERLEKNFSSAFHEVRLLTAHIYTLFEHLPELNPDSDMQKWTLFTVIHKIESIDPQVQTYREQLQCLEKLTYGKAQISQCEKTLFASVPLRYLCGMLYLNFRLLWEPTVKVVASYAQGMRVEEFWRVFGEELKNVVRNIQFPKDGEENMESDKGNLFAELNELGRDPDFVNYRQLLWTAMALFPEVAEAKTRDCSELLLQFVENEFMKGNTGGFSTCNIKQKMEPEDIEEESAKCKSESKTEKKTDGGNVKTLIYHLTVFTKIKSPKSMYREPELYNLYLQLLSHRNAQVQKFALDCIATYKHKFLTPYKDHVYNLIDEKNFKNELATFRVDNDNNLIQNEHRTDLIPIVMRIVFSKMTLKSGMRTGGASGGEKRRQLVLRFLAGCPENELLCFVRMAFKGFEGFEGDLERFLLPKKLQSSANLLFLMFDHFSGTNGKVLHKYLVGILLVLGRLLKCVWDDVDSVHSGFLSTLRNVRTTCLKVASLVFERIDGYEWENEELDAFFEAFVWPHVDKLDTEGVYTPTVLLKLVSIWASNPKYFALLVKTSKNKTVLSQVVQLFSNPKAHVSVLTYILEMFEKLLTLENDSEMISVENSSEVAKNVHLNYGSRILLPHVLEILRKLETKLAKAGTISKKELFVLYRMSELVCESDECEKVLQLLLPVTLKRLRFNLDEETVQQTLITLQNMLKNVPEPRKHLKQISPLFGTVNYVSGRKILCEILDLISDDLKLVAELNAWDAKWLDQPDYERRLGAFKHIQNLCQTEIDPDLGILVVYNCYHMLCSEKDISLKDNASECLKLLSPVLIKQSKNHDYVLDTVFNLIRKGMNKTGDTRNEFVQLLGRLASECPDSHVILSNLNPLTNRLDPEVDFFENLTHLQTHRHARALLKFCQTARQQTSIYPRTLTQFILPLASHYLCCEKYASKNSIVDAAIETVCVVSRLLPWHHYEGLLKFYLTKLRRKSEYQKQLVRIAVGVLDGFHFDLSKGEVRVAERVVEGEERVESEPEKSVVGGDAENLGLNEEVDGEENVLEDVEDGARDEEEGEGHLVEVKAYERVGVLCKSTATRVVKIIQTVILPQLHKSLAEMSPSEGSHKVNKKKHSRESEEVDLLRVPLFLAVVKLLQRLPKGILESNLPAVLTKLCTFLRSHLESVRRIARETLQKILSALGPDYLGLLMEQMVPLLGRGFQTHVLVFTVHGVLNCLKERYRPLDIDRVLATVLRLCKVDLFGYLAEEKEVAKIAGKVSEARSTKSYDTLKLLAQYITDKCLLDLILPIKETLASSHSYKSVHKAQECLRFIAQGLSDNKFITTQSLLIFAYGTASERIQELKPEKQSTVTEENGLRTDCLIIPDGPKGRRGMTPYVKKSGSVNAHVLVEFGLRLCFIMLKRDLLREDEYRAFVDPFVGVFRDCLGSRHVRLCTVTLNCLSWVLKYDLPSMQEHISDFVEMIFEILHKYAAAGLSKGENYDMVVAAFKTVTVLIRDANYYTIETDKLKILLLHSEEDLHSVNRQATAFGLLKAIISRKLIVPEIYGTMEKVQELSITSEMPHVRSQSLAVMHQFLMDYPLGKKLDKYVAFYVSQLECEMQYGRESALVMVHGFVSSFPHKVLKEYSGSFMITLGARVINDEVSDCRKAAANCLKVMFTKLLKSDRDALFDMILLWFEDKKFTHKSMASHLCALMATVENSEFETRLPKLFPHLLHQFELTNVDKPGRFVRVNRTSDNESMEKIKDHHLFHVLQMLLKLCTHCPTFLHSNPKEIEALARHAQTLLAHPHDWVRFASAQFLGFVLDSLNVESVTLLLLLKETAPEGTYLSSNPAEEVKSLALDLCAQLQVGVKNEFARQIIKNLVFVAKVLQNVPSENRLNLLWLVKRLRKIVNREVVESPSSVVLRMEVFKFFGAVGSILDAQKLEPVLQHLLGPLVREMMTTEEGNAPLRQLSKDVGNLLKKKVGLDVYSGVLAKSQMQLNVTRAERKKSKRQLAVTDPEAFAKKKIKWQEKKKVDRKRKIVRLKVQSKKTKRRKVEEEFNNDDVF